MQKENKVLYSLIVDDKEFYFFLKKFVGSLIFRGNKSRAIKMFDEILFNIKKNLRKDPIVVLYAVFRKLIPIFSIAYKRIGNRYHPVPKLAGKNVRVVLMTDWLIRSLKNKSNVRGVKVEDIIKVIIDTYNNKGKALFNKKAFYKRALSGRHLLSTQKFRNKRFSFRKSRKTEFSF